MMEDDRDIAALFAAEPPTPADPGFVARVADEVERLRRRRVALMSAAGLASGLGGGAALALAAPVLGEAGRILGDATRSPAAAWAVAAAGLMLAIGVPLWRRR